MIILLLMISLLGMFSCTPAISIEAVLELSGKNRVELEKVLRHYKDDRQKSRAVCFLIENMPRKGTIFYEGQWNEKRVVQADLLSVKSDFLIENIDLAFEVWKKYPWCSHLSENEFFCKILPYRLKNEPLEDWRKFYYAKYREVADSLATAGAGMYDVVFFFNSHYGKKYTHAGDSLLGDLSYRQMEAMGGGTCDRLALNAVQVMRSIGIPLDLDELPYHGKVNGGHAYNSFTDENGTFHYFSPYEREPERKLWVAPLVRRVNFGTPRYEDVTSSYYRVADVMLDAPDIGIATYNRGRLKKVKDGEVKDGQTIIKDLSCGLLYFPVDSLIGLVNLSPFVLEMDGEPRFVSEMNRSDSVRLDGIRLYDVKRVLALGKGAYTLYGWKDGWKELKTAVSRDSVSLDFGFVPDYKLFVVRGNTTIERMQRPFIVENDSIVYY